MTVTLKNYLECCWDDNSHTPDLPHLMWLYEKIPVFMYGPEKRGFSEGKLFTDYKYVGSGFTCANTFVMRLIDDTDPVVFQDPASSEAATIYGDVYVIPTNALPKIDARFNNGIVFNRRKITCRYSFPRSRHKDVTQYFISEAWMYTGSNEYFTSLKERGTRSIFANRFTPNTGTRDYFVYTSKDDARNKSKGVVTCLS